MNARNWNANKYEALVEKLEKLSEKEVKVNQEVSKFYSRITNINELYIFKRRVYGLTFVKNLNYIQYCTTKGKFSLKI